MKRYSLRVFVLAFILVAVGLSAFANHRERKLVRWIEASGGSVRYDYRTRNPRPIPFSTRWREKRDEFWRRITFELHTVKLPPCLALDAERLKGFSRLKTFVIVDDQYRYGESRLPAFPHREAEENTPEELAIHWADLMEAIRHFHTLAPHQGTSGR